MATNNPTLEQTSARVLSYLADLNGCQWITGDGPGERDMRQRAKSLQRLLFRALQA